MHNFLVIGVPLLSIAFYVFVAGAVYSGLLKWFAKGYHKAHHREPLYPDEKSCVDCTGLSAVGGGLWPFVGFFFAGTVLATKRRVKRAEKVARRIADLEREVFPD